MVIQTPVDPDSVQRQDRLLRVIADARRRSVVRSLQECGDLPLDELAKRVERSERPRTDVDGQDGRDERDERTRRIRVDLYHRQLPILTEADLVAFDPDDRVAAITDRGADVCASLGSLKRIAC